MKKNRLEAVETRLGQVEKLLKRNKRDLKRLYDGREVNPPTPVSDGKWEIIPGHVGTLRLELRYNHKHMAWIPYSDLPAFRTLIAKEKLCEKVCELLVDYKCGCFNLNVRRDTLIAEYEEADK